MFDNWKDFFTFQNILTWLIGGVFVSIAVNIISAFLVKPIERRLAKSSAWWGARSEKKRLERQNFIESLIGNKKLQQRVQADENRSRLNAIYFSVSVASNLMVVVLFTGLQTRPISEAGWVFNIIGGAITLMILYSTSQASMAWAKATRLEKIIKVVEEVDDKNEQIELKINKEIDRHNSLVELKAEIKSDNL